MTNSATQAQEVADLLQHRAASDILERITDAFFAVDHEWRFTYLSEQAKDVLGRIPGDLVGKILWEEYPDLLGTEFEIACRRAASERVGSSVTSFFPGHDRWYEVRARPAHCGITAQFHDVTKIKETEEALRLSERRFCATADHAPVLLWISDAQNRHYWFNKRWLDFTGRTMAQEAGDGWLESVHPDDRDRCRATIATFFAARAPFTIEYRLRRNDGAYRWVVGSGVPYYGPDGEFAGYIGSCSDTHDRIEAERSLREADRRKDEFLAMLAHELRNPLAALDNAVTVLKLSSDQENITFANRVIERQTRQLARLIDDLLDASRITSGNIRLKTELCDARPILNHAAESVAPLIKERKHDLVLDFEEGAFPIRVDPTRMEQVLVNLLDNAAKYSENARCVYLGAKRQDDEIVITVEDQGFGIAPETLPGMFELFVQGERSVARSDGGLGIGLTLVQKLTQMHGGHITAFSEGLGKGCQFRIYLPLATPLASADGEPGPRDSVRRCGARVLVIDDNVDMAQSLAVLMKLHGNEVEIAYDGHCGINLARAFRPEFVLLDIGLPGIDGYQVAQTLRGERCCDRAVIIAISGYGQEEDRRRSREAGFDHHLVKPVDLDSLVSLLSLPH